MPTLSKVNKAASKPPGNSNSEEPKRMLRAGGDDENEGEADNAERVVQTSTNKSSSPNSTDPTVVDGATDRLNEITDSMQADCSNKDQRKPPSPASSKNDEAPEWECNYEWECKSCTFTNSNRRRKCRMCLPTSQSKNLKRKLRRKLRAGDDDENDADASNAKTVQTGNPKSNDPAAVDGGTVRLNVTADSKQADCNNIEQRKPPPPTSSNGDCSGKSDESEIEEEKEPERPFEPLMVWQSPHQGGEAKGLPPRL